MEAYTQLQDGKVTDESLVIAPTDYWGKTLKADVEEILHMKKKRHRRVRPEAVAITLSVNDRSQRNLQKFIILLTSTGNQWRSSYVNGAIFFVWAKSSRSELPPIRDVMMMVSLYHQEESKREAMCLQLAECWLSVRHTLMRKNRRLDDPQLRILCMTVCDVISAHVL